jgi:hypothetical protein
METVMDLANVDRATAEKALEQYGDVILAVDALLSKPVVAGDKYIPPKPKVDTGMSAEQEERCAKGRWLQDKVNVVFSAAHQSTKTQPAHEALQDEAHLASSASVDLPVYSS